MKAANYFFLRLLAAAIEDQYLQTLIFDASLQGILSASPEIDCEEVLKKALEKLRKKTVDKLRDANGVGFNDVQIDFVMKKYQKEKNFKKLLIISVLAI